MRCLPPGLLAAVAVLTDLTSAVRFDVQGRRHAEPALKHWPRDPAHMAALTNSGDISYYTNITLGGIPFSVLIDTGR